MYRQQATIILTIPVTLSLIEITFSYHANNVVGISKYYLPSSLSQIMVITKPATRSYCYFINKGAQILFYHELLYFDNYISIYLASFIILCTLFYLFIHILKRDS